MARYKDYDYSQSKFIPIHFDKQILPGTFEHTLHYLIDNEIDMSIFDSRYQNDDTGAPAYDPAILLKIILLDKSSPIRGRICMKLYKKIEMLGVRAAKEIKNNIGKHR